MTYTRPDDITVSEDCCYTFDTWEELVKSENEETYPLTEEQLKEMVGKNIWQLPNGRWCWDVTY